MGFIRQRVITGVALLITLLLLIYTATLSESSLQWLIRDYGLTRAHLLLYYAIWGVALGAVCLFEPALRRELQQSYALGAVVLASLILAILPGWLLNGDQQLRVFHPVPALSLVIAYTSGIAACLVLLALESPFSPPTRRMTRYALLVLLAMIGVLVIFEIISVGRFGRLDDVFDEFMLAGNMTNYAAHGKLTSSFLNNIYGDWDPSTPRFYLAGGLWLRLFAAPSLTVLRSWPLIVGGFGALLTAVTLWRARMLANWQRLIGLLLLLANIVFVRMSHNLRMDIGLTVYGALVLLFYLESERSTRPRLFLFLAGLALYIGLETQSFSAFLHGVSYGLILLVYALTGKNKLGSLWRHVVPYTIGAAVAGSIFVIVHFLPDFPAKWAAMQSYHDMYLFTGSVGSAFPLSRLSNVLQFDLLFSPIEPFLIIAIMTLSVIFGSTQVRRLALIAGTSLLLNLTFLNGAFSYNCVLLPILAYCGASMVRQRAAALLIVFVFLPSLMIVPLHDLAFTTQADNNTRLVNELNLLDWRIPDGARVVGSDIFWLTLEARTQFTGAGALKYIGHRLGIDPNSPQAFNTIQPDIGICRPDQEAAFCATLQAYFHTEPFPFAITDGTYSIYLRSGSS